jgi:transposase
MTPYSMDLRQRMLQDCDAGLSTKTVADKFKVRDSFVRKLKRRRREQGTAAPTSPRRPPPRWAADADRIRAAVAAQSDLTLAELKARLNLAYSLATLGRAGAALGLTVKKKSAGRPSRIVPTWRPNANRGGSGSRRSTPSAGNASMKPERPRTWRGAMAGRGVAHGWSAWCRKGTGRRPLSWLR